MASNDIILVTNKHIDRIITGIRREPGIVKRVHKEYNTNLAKLSDRRDFGDLLLEMNSYAKAHIDGGSPEDYYVVGSYVPRKDTTMARGRLGLIQTIKAIRALQINCPEQRDNPIYKILEHIAQLLGLVVVVSLPDYKKSGWII